jgi:hypothetical protein
MTQAAQSTVTATDIPEHVPHDLVVDYDRYHRAAQIDDLQALWVGLRQKAPKSIFWIPRNGGHWVALVGADSHRATRLRVFLTHRYIHSAEYATHLPASTG